MFEIGQDILHNLLAGQGLRATGRLDEHEIVRHVDDLCIISRIYIQGGRAVSVRSGVATRIGEFRQALGAAVDRDRVEGVETRASPGGDPLVGGEDRIFFMFDNGLL